MQCGAQCELRQFAHAEAHHEPGIDDRSDTDRRRQHAEIDGKQAAETVLLLEYLLGGAEIADEGAEDEAGRQGIAQGDGIADALIAQTGKWVLPQVAIAVPAAAFRADRS